MMEGEGEREGDPVTPHAFSLQKYFGFLCTVTTVIGGADGGAADPGPAWRVFHCASFFFLIHE